MNDNNFLQERFPDPKSLVKDLHHTGFKAIWMLDPGIKCEEGYFVYDSGCKHDAWIQKADGTSFVGILLCKFLFKFNYLSLIVRSFFLF